MSSAKRPDAQAQQEGRQRVARYSVTVFENHRRLDRRPIVDPFINTYVRPSGWRAALAVMLGRYEVEVQVRADKELTEQVLELDPEYLGEWGSERRKAWDARVQAAFASFAGEDDDDD
jgi:hypothetical protein